jgi:hypothetical protein
MNLIIDLHYLIENDKTNWCQVKVTVHLPVSQNSSGLEEMLRSPQSFLQGELKHCWGVDHLRKGYRSKSHVLYAQSQEELDTKFHAWKEETIAFFKNILATNRERASALSSNYTLEIEL